MMCKIERRKSGVCGPGLILNFYKVPLRDVHRGVAQERIEKHTACDMVSYALVIILRRYEISVL